MPLTLIERRGGQVLEVWLTGTLTREDYARFVPETESLIKTRGKLNMVVVMQDFHGWDVGGLWQDLRWDMKHGRHLDRVAFVGEKQWQKGMSLFCKPFTSAQVQFFELPDLDSARLWAEHASEAVAA